MVIPPLQGGIDSATALIQTHEPIRLGLPLVMLAGLEVLRQSIFVCKGVEAVSTSGILIPVEVTMRFYMPQHVRLLLKGLFTDSTQEIDGLMNKGLVPIQGSL